MSISFPPPPIRTPFTTAQGIVTAPWLQWFRLLYERVGGPVAPTIVELASALPEDAGTEELKGLVYNTFDGLNQRPVDAPMIAADALLPPSVTVTPEVYLETRISALAAELAQLRTDLNDLRQGPNP